MKGMKEIEARIKKISRSLELPEGMSEQDLFEDAKKLFLQMRKEGMTRSYGNQILIKACILYIFKHDPGCQSMTISQFAESLSSEKHIKSIYKLYMKITEIKGKPPVLCNIRPHRLIDGLCEDLNLSKVMKEKSHGLCDEVVKKRLHLGKDPKVIAATCIYISAWQGGNRRSQAEIERKVKVTAVAIRRNFKVMLKHLRDYIQAM